MEADTCAVQAFAADRNWRTAFASRVGGPVLSVLRNGERRIMFTTIGAALAGSPPPLGTRQRVRRHSRLAGRCEGVFWRATSRQEVRRVVLAARRYELAGRQPGKRSGPLGHVALEVLELLGNLVSYRTGRLDPSLDTLMRLLRRSRAAPSSGFAA